MLLYRREIFEPLKAASDAYFARRKAVEGQKVFKAGEAIPLIPFIAFCRLFISFTFLGLSFFWLKKPHASVATELITVHYTKILIGVRRKDEFL